jgi:hypothetical protein
MFDYAFNGENRYRGYLKPFPKPVHGTFHLGETLDAVVIRHLAGGDVSAQSAGSSRPAA